METRDLQRAEEREDQYTATKESEVGRVALVEVSRPNATLVEADIEAVIRGLKARLVGEIAVSGPDLARSLTDFGLIDEYRLLLPPRRAWSRKPFFAARGHRSALFPPIRRRGHG